MKVAKIPCPVLRSLNEKFSKWNYYAKTGNPDIYVKTLNRLMRVTGQVSKDCLVCGRTFKDKSAAGIGLYCSARCNKISNKELGQPPTVTTTECKVCHNQFSYPIKGHRKTTCSPGCKAQLNKIQQHESYMRFKNNGKYRTKEFKQMCQLWRQRNPDKVKAVKARAYKKQVDKVADWYVRTASKKMLKAVGLTDFPSEAFIKAKRKGIILHRTIQKIKHAHL